MDTGIKNKTTNSKLILVSVITSLVGALSILILSYLISSKLIIIEAIIMFIVLYFTSRFLMYKFFITPIKEIRNSTCKMAKGDFNIKFNTGSKDEIGLLASDLSLMLENLRNIINEINKMVEIHSLGDYEYKIDESKYEGEYKKIVIGAQKPVFMYINNFVELLGVIGSYGEGDFSVNVRKYPGKQATGNDVVNSLRNNLISINKNIQYLIDEAVLGHLSTRVDSKGFKGEWAEAFNKLNSLLDAISNPIMEASDVLLEMSKGNLQVLVKGDYKGDFALIKNSLNNTITILSGYMEEITTVLYGLSNKDLTNDIKTDFLGDFVTIKDSINMIVKTMSIIMQEISTSTEQINSGAKMVSESSMVLAEDSLKHSETVNKLSQGIEYINKQAIINVENAKLADGLSIKSMENAKNGNSEMNRMLEAMEGIKQASDNISQIMRVIDDITFQTNLLALNAAVEAARAGEYGKGFAVVADEVRTLSAKSHEAAKKTQEHIDDTIEKINNGTEIANETSEALVKIVDNINEISSLIFNITSASEEQADSISKVTVGVDEISKIVVNNSSTSEENAAVAQELSSQVEVLNDLISTFKFKNGIN